MAELNRNSDPITLDCYLEKFLKYLLVLIILILIAGIAFLFRPTTSKQVETANLIKMKFNFHFSLENHVKTMIEVFNTI